MLTKVVFTQEELQERLEMWQKRLRLQDWIIKAGIARERNFVEPGRAAEIEWLLESKVASIRVLDPCDYPDDCMVPQDMEDSLIHELLHLHFASISNHFGNQNDVYQTFEEQAIISIASGLIASARERN